MGGHLVAELNVGVSEFCVVEFNKCFTRYSLKAGLTFFVRREFQFCGSFLNGDVLTVEFQLLELLFKTLLITEIFRKTCNVKG